MLYLETDMEFKIGSEIHGYRILYFDANGLDLYDYYKTKDEAEADYLNYTSEGIFESLPPILESLRTIGTNLLHDVHTTQIWIRESFDL